MPIYDYVCANGHRVEVMHGVHDSGPQLCSQCGAPLRKALTTPAIHFRGSGWAKKDRASARGSTARTDASKSDTGTADKQKSDKDAGSAGKASEGSAAGDSS
jgi:putative FmdB family regulatory protein